MAYTRVFAMRAAVVMGAVAAATALGAAPAHATPTTLYVGGAGCSDTGPGSAAQPFCTITKGAAVAVAGQTVEVAAGTYDGQVSVGHSGTAGAPIVLRPATGAAVTVTSAAVGFYVSGKSYVTISGFTVSGTISYGIKLSSSSNIVVSGNTVTDAGQPFSGQLAAGIYLSNTSASTVTGNNSHHNSDHGIYLTSTTTTTTVSYNQASWNANGYRRNANGINVIGTNNAVIGNILHDNEDSGLQFYTAATTTWPRQRHLQQRRPRHRQPERHRRPDHRQHRLSQLHERHQRRGNVRQLSGREQHRGRQRGLPRLQRHLVQPPPGKHRHLGSAPSSTIVDSNLVFLTTAGTMYVFGSSYTSLAAMKAATGQEQHGLQADPLFAGAAAGNLWLLSGSPAIDSADSGVSGAQPADVLGIARVDDPATVNTGLGPRSYDDRGAYEHVP